MLLSGNSEVAFSSTAATTAPASSTTGAWCRFVWDGSFMGNGFRVPPTHSFAQEHVRAAERLKFHGFDGGRAVVRAFRVMFNTFVGDEAPFDSSVGVFKGNGVAPVNSGCILVFESLWFLADEDPGLLWECTPVFLCTPVVLFGLVSRIIVWIVACDAGGGTLFVRFVKDFGLVHLEPGLEVAEL
jgi:hypothetical protein